MPGSQLTGFQAVAGTGARQRTSILLPAPGGAQCRHRPRLYNHCSCDEAAWSLTLHHACGRPSFNGPQCWSS